MGGGEGGLVITIIFHIQSRDKGQMDISIPHLKGNRPKKIFCNDCEITMCQISERAEQCQDSRDNYNGEKKKKRGTASVQSTWQNLNGGGKKNERFYRRQSIEQVVKLETRAEKRGQCGFPCRTD